MGCVLILGNGRALDENGFRDNMFVVEDLVVGLMLDQTLPF